MTSLREDIAKVIDGRAWQPHGFTGDPDWHPDDQRPEQQRSLYKADQIIAILSSSDTAARLIEARTQLFGLCEHLQDEAVRKMNSISVISKDPVDFHNRGYCWGQRSTAKGIARAMTAVFRDLLAETTNAEAARND